MSLVVIGDDKNFRNGDSEISNLLSRTEIIFTGKISDDELKKIISESKFLIQPSLYEGFGLPPLESLYLGTKPIVSDIEVFKEIYSDLPVVFFKTGSALDLQDKILNGDSAFCLDINELEQNFLIKSLLTILKVFLKK